jgi:hypothetical protein
LINRKELATVSDESKSRRSFDTMDSATDDENSQSFITMDYFSAEDYSDTNKTMDLIGIQDINRLLRSYFHEDLHTIEDSRIIAARNLNLAEFRSFTTDGRKAFEDVIWRHEALNEPIPTPNQSQDSAPQYRSKEELFVVHVFNEFQRLVVAYKKISDCSTAAAFMSKMKQVIQEKKEQFTLPSADLSKLTPLQIFHDEVQLDPSLTGFDLKETYEKHFEDKSDIALAEKEAELKQWYELNVPRGHILQPDGSLIPITCASSKKRALDDDGRKKPKGKKRKRGENVNDIGTTVTSSQNGPPKKERRKWTWANKRSLEDREKRSRHMLKYIWLSTNETDTYAPKQLRKHRRIPALSQVDFEQFRQNVFHGFPKAWFTVELGKIMDEFMVRTLYELLLDYRSYTSLSQEDCNFILTHISRLPEKRRHKNKEEPSKATVPNNEEGNNGPLVDQQDDNLNQIDTDSTVQEATQLQEDWTMVIKKVKSEFVNVEAGLEDVQKVDPKVLNQEYIVKKYDKLVTFCDFQLKDQDFSRYFEMESPFSLDNPLVVKSLLNWKEFMKMAMYYSFVEKEVDEVYSPGLVGLEPNEETSMEILQILDSGMVESIPTADSQQCFDRPLRYIVNMDGHARKKSSECLGYCYGEETGNQTNQDANVENLVFDVGTVRLKHIPTPNSVGTEDDEDDEDSVCDTDIVVDGKILYDTQALYVNATGILNPIHLLDDSLSPWLSEFLAVDLWNLWEQRIAQPL